MSTNGSFNRSQSIPRSPDPSINYDIAYTAYLEGTATWFFENSMFKDWMSFGSLLWVHGKPGSGKSIICSAIIKQIAALYESGSVAYFFFDFRDREKQNVRNFIISLLSQLSAFSGACRDVISRLYSAHGNGTRQPTTPALRDCLMQILSVLAEHPTYIVVDAREEVLVVVKDLVGLHLPHLRVCVTSRPEVDIKYVLNHLTIHAVSLHDQSEQKKGIADYVSTVVNSDVKMREWPDEDKELVIKDLSERADGMFRWVVCQLETLRRLPQRNLRVILSRLPESLDETYERMLKAIKKYHAEYARRLLHCLVVAVRPLRVEELAEILAFDFDDTGGGIPKFRADWRWKDSEEAVLSTCSSLIAINNYDHSSSMRVVQFSHFSVKEFLMSNRLASSTPDVSRYHILPEPAHTILAQACVESLLFVDDRIDNASTKDISLAEYAADHWVTHVQFEEVARHVKDGMASLFKPDKPHFAPWFAKWVAIYLKDEPYQTYREFSSRMPTPLYHSSLYGSDGFVDGPATENPQPLYAMGDWYDFSLLVALRRRHFTIVKILLLCVVSVGIRGMQGRTLLHDIIGSSDADIVQFLLEQGADVNAQQDDLTTPLHLAVRDSQEPSVAIVKLLLERGADAHARDKYYTTPWLLARNRGRFDIAKVLLYHDAKAPRLTKIWYH